MAVYVDTLLHHGWVLRGHVVKSCHLFADTLEELHQLAAAIGMKPQWFQNHRRLPHYDLTASRRELALKSGAQDVDRRTVALHMRKERFR